MWCSGVPVAASATKANVGSTTSPIVLTPDYFSQLTKALDHRIKEKETEIQQMSDRCTSALSKAATQADRWAWAGFGFYVAQTALLFYWVYVRFDWNLVEPITYLLGYTCVWISLVSFFFTRTEFGFAAWRSKYVVWKANRIAKIDIESTLKALTQECEALRARRSSYRGF